MKLINFHCKDKTSLSRKLPFIITTNASLKKVDIITNLQRVILVEVHQITTIKKLRLERINRA